MAAPMLRAGPLDLPGLTHGFFTRAGGVSKGLYASLNGGLGSNDDPAAVAENHARMARALGVERGRLLVPYQVHSADVARVTAPWPAGERPRVDGLVTDVAGLAIGVTGADCGMVLFADAAARVVGVAHAGWKGALAGILEATVDGHGAARRDARRRSPPCWGRRSARAPMRSGRNFARASSSIRPDNARFFAGGTFDLPGYIGDAPAVRPASANSPISGSTPMPTKRDFSATAAACIGARPITAGSLRRSRSMKSALAEIA